MSPSPLSAASNALSADHDRGVCTDAVLCAAPPAAVGQERVATAVV